MPLGRAPHSLALEAEFGQALGALNVRAPAVLLDESAAAAARAHFAVGAQYMTRSIRHSS